MPFQKGNRFWELRSKHGRNPIFADPEQLWESCTEYFSWCEDNPLYAAEVVKFQGEATLTDVPKMRAMTLSGLCLFLDISKSAWEQYRQRNDFISVCTRAEEIIYNQKFAGAAADLLNASIIARDLGLADRKEHTGKNGGPIQTISADMDPAEAAQIYRDMIKGGNTK